MSKNSVGLFEQCENAQESLIEDVRRFFSPTGVLAHAKNFEYRPQQQEMALAVTDALLNGKKLLVEGGTGVGKSLAYLVPAILYSVIFRKKAIISTDTINLQEQLYTKDLPLLQKVLPVSFSYIMMKGRQNYLCTHRLDKAQKNAQHLFTSTEKAELERIYKWSQKTEDGSISDMDEAPISKVWNEVCSVRGLCTPKICGPDSDFALNHPPCFFQKIRHQLISADLILLNHALFFSQLALNPNPPEDSILFRNDFVIFDEAHTLESVASDHIGISLSNYTYKTTLQRLYNPRTQKGLLTILIKPEIIPIVCDALEAGEKFFLDIETACDEIQSEKEDSKRSKYKWTETRILRPDLCPNTLDEHLQKIRDLIADILDSDEATESANDLRDCDSRLYEIQNSLALFLNYQEGSNVYWVERSRSQMFDTPSISINMAPINIAGYLRQRIFEVNTGIILTSATLSIEDKGKKESKKETAPAIESPKRRWNDIPEHVKGLEYTANRIGAQGAEMLQVGSPFNYEHQVKLYLPNKMPEPSDSSYPVRVEHYIRKLVKMMNGKTLILFTSNKLMHTVADDLEDFFLEEQIDPLVQGEKLSRWAMLEHFKSNPNSVLFGLDSFWKGIDVPGKALSCVIITQLPFTVPDRPLTQARVEEMKKNNRNPFAEYSLPEALIRFRQGFGRLIRTATDTGIIAVLDGRLQSKNYGTHFLNAIPKCPIEYMD